MIGMMGVMTIVGVTRLVGGITIVNYENLVNIGVGACKATRCAHSEVLDYTSAYQLVSLPETVAVSQHLNKSESEIVGIYRLLMACCLLHLK